MATDKDEHKEDVAIFKDSGEDKQLLPQKQVQIIDPVKAVNSLGECCEKDPAEQRISLKAYRRRWIVLFVVALLNNLNTMLWIAFSPISNHVDTFYGRNSTIYFSAVYIFVTIPIGIFAIYSILIAAWANGIGAFIRLASSFFPDDMTGFRFPVGISGQAIAALAYPFIMFLPTKVAAAWFPDNQRTLATTIGVMSNPLGVLLANLISPMIVGSCEHVKILNILFSVPSIILTVVASVAITSSEPKIPPTLSASKPSYPFIEGIKKCFTSKQYLVLLLVMGGGIGMFNALYTLMQQLLCPSGYSNQFSGFTSALLITGGVVGATGATAYPVGLQLSAECTYPVSETTSTGLVVLSGQIQTIIYLSVMKTLATPLQSLYRKYEVCTLLKVAEHDHLSSIPPTCGHGNISINVADNEQTVEPMDFTLSVIVMSMIAAFIVLILLLLFRPKLRRMEMENVLLNADSGKELEVGVKIEEEKVNLKIITPDGKKFYPTTFYAVYSKVSGFFANSSNSSRFHNQKSIEGKMDSLLSKRKIFNDSNLEQEENNDVKKRKRLARGERIRRKKRRGEALQNLTKFNNLDL
uniref:MFS domain-containing protein n=1 Tax=Meloidogyne floridensis TaxID=298350 RepID=A0A915NYH8_9BILA